jgi:Rv0078B-related antitoxin
MVEAKHRREHPEATEAEIVLVVQRWWSDRPGAAQGDAVGRQRTLDPT